MKATMKAMILAAGRGERLRPLTDHTPKPLIAVGDRPLIGHHLSALAAAGFEQVVINVAYRGDQIMHALGDGSAWGLQIAYSPETPGALDTGGGVRNALHLLGDGPFALISADVFSNFDYARLHGAAADSTVHAVLVDNPAHHARGDFGLRGEQLVDESPCLTYAGIGVYHPALFASRSVQRFGLVTVIREAIAAAAATGEHHGGRWIDVGRPSALAAARAWAASD